MGNFLKWKDLHLILKKTGTETMMVVEMGRGICPCPKAPLFFPPSSWSPHRSPSWSPHCSRNTGWPQGLDSSWNALRRCLQGSPLTFYRPLPDPNISLRTATAHLPNQPALSHHTTLRLHLTHYKFACLFISLFPHENVSSKKVGLSRFCSLLHLQLLEQCLTQNKCSINNACLFLKWKNESCIS